MAQSTLQRLVDLAGRSITALGGAASPVDLERLAIDVHETMSAGGRSFHDVGHVFEVAEGGSPAEVLAALFHDTVYLQVDEGLPARLESTLADAYEVVDGSFRLRVGEDPWKARLAALFGFQEGQALTPYAGLNEFLSALFAARRLEGLVDAEAILRVATCIEATVPFRGGEEVAEALFDRLVGLGLVSDPEQAVCEAVRMANRDVANFAFADPARFLDNTWALLPESNAQLRVRVYTVDQYQLAMGKMYGFFGFLKPEVVHRAFRGTPAPAELARLREATARNLRIGHEYLGAKLLAASLLQAIASLTGGDAPISLFMGDLPSVCATSPRIESLFPAPLPGEDVDPVVLRLLQVGRATEGEFDLRNAPLAGFLYASCGHRVHELVEVHRSGGAEALLRAVPTTALEPVVEGCATLAITRAEAIRALLG